MTARAVLAGRYELRDVLGRGGMAEVRDGWDIRLDRAVAVKLLHTAFGADPTIRRRFEWEARAAAALNHPNIVAVHDSGEHDGMPFIVMERLPGNTFADAIGQGPVPSELLRRVLDDVLAALTAAHDAGVLHRDIKPGNILFTPSGHVKLSDFGIAKTAGAEPTLTGQIVGTMAYLSPDRLAGKPATISDDLYSVGVVGYEGLTGRRPFEHDNMAAMARAILDQRPPPIPALRPGADPALVAVVGRAMSNDASQRFASARQMRAALRDANPGPARPATAVMTSPVPPATFIPVARTGWTPPNRKQTLIGLVALLAFFLLAAVLLMANSPFDTPQPVTTSTPVPATTPPPPPPTSVAVDEGNSGNRSEEGEKKREEEQKKLEEEQKKLEEQQQKREEEQNKRE